MKAAVITQYGGPECFSVETNIPEPVPSKNQVKIQVIAAGINPLDYRIRNGELKLFISARFPMILGNDAAGIVAEIGADVRNFSVGDRVFGLLDANQTPSRRGFAKPGCYAEFAITREDTLAILPDEIDYISAAAMPLAALNAYQALNNLGDLREGQHILINGASGGVGTFAVQIAKAMGLIVTAVSSEKNCELVLSLGADKWINYRTDPLEDFKGKFDVIYDVVANQSFSKLSHLLTPNGIYMSNVASLSTMMSGAVGILVSPFGKLRRNRHAWVNSNSKDMNAIAALMANGRIRSVVDQVFQLEDVRVAHELIQSGRTAGKLVFDVANSS